MAKSDLLKQAIADANAVKETALANAKIALQEAFAPRIQSMLGEKLRMELEGDEDEEMTADVPMDADMDTDLGDMGAEGEDAMNGTDVGDLSIDVNNDGEFDEFDIMSREPMGEPGMEEPMGEPGMEAPEMSDDEMDAEYNEGYDHDDLELESIIRELEGGLEDEAEMDEPMDDEMMHEGDYSDDDTMDEDINAIIEAILREEDMDIEGDVSADDEDGNAKVHAELAETKTELEEAYKTVKKLSGIINEVNLLNAKLLYTNKLFRNFELNEAQKMKVIENFDRAGNTREVKLVFSTLAESFTRPTTKKRVVKESYASKPTRTTAPKTSTILNEGFEYADRWKKLAGLL
jgi:hypothetical protein